MSEKDGDNMTDMTTSLSDDQERLLLSLFESKGIVTEACKNAGLSRETHYRWLRENEAYADSYASIEESAIDFVEGKMFARIEDGSDGLIKFYLATKAKKRGYVERHEQESIGGVPPVVILRSNEIDDFIKDIESKETEP